MTRGISAATLSAIENEVASPIHFIKIDIDTLSSPQVFVHLHTGRGTINTLGADYTGAGALLAVDGASENADMNPAPFRASLAANSEIMDIVFSTNYYRSPVTVYLGALSLPGAVALIEPPSAYFSGFIEDLPLVFGDAQNGDIVTLEAESEMYLWERSRNKRITDRDLQAKYPGDLGFNYAEATAVSRIVWRGRANNLGGTTSRGGDFGGETDYGTR